MSRTETGAVVVEEETGAEQKFGTTRYSRFKDTHNFVEILPAVKNSTVSKVKFTFFV